ncbi:MAG: hypothetical protein ACE5GW_11755, partial [Planctomycetota bacterium]
MDLRPRLPSGLPLLALPCLLLLPFFGLLSRTVSSLPDGDDDLRRAERLFEEKSYKLARELYEKLIPELEGEERARGLVRLASCHEALREWPKFERVVTGWSDLPF